MGRHRGATILLLTAAFGLAAHAADDLVPRRVASTLAAPVLKAAPTIDGALSDAAWKAAQPLRDFCYSKGVRCATEGWIARDEKNLYFAARCFDDNLKGLVVTNTGRALWRNDCIELFIVPEKNPLFFTHLIFSCDGKFSAPTWVPDEWGEPTEGPPVALQYATGRDKDAWTFEAAVPLAAFGRAVTPQSVWALGFNREKHSDPEEVSSFQGGFNKPAQYPDLVFDGRTVLADGLGLLNIGAAQRQVKVTVKPEGGGEGKALTLDLPAGERVAIPWREHVAGLKAGQSFVIETADAGGKALLREEYKLVEAARPVVAVDPNNIPPAKFAKSVLDDPAFFPIAVWLQPAGAAKGYQEMGVNVYVGGIDSYPKPRGKEFLDAIQACGMVAFAPFTAEYLEQGLHRHPAFLGWMHGDEPDNVSAETGQVIQTPQDLIANLARIRAADSAHRIFLNLGQGVAEERFIGRGATVAQYREYPKACDVLCFDVYPCNSIEPDGPERLHLVAKGIDRLRQWGGAERPAWVWIEANQFGKGGEGRCPTPDEVKTQIWMALVHGARGYGFFCHSWAKAWLKRDLGMDSNFSPTAIAEPMRKALKAVNGEVKELAPVLNSPTLDAGARVEASDGGRVDVMVKKHGGATYVFAVNMKRKSTKAAIRVAGAAGGKAEVLYENRTVEAKDGVIADEFAPYAVHRYKLPQ